MKSTSPDKTNGYLTLAIECAAGPLSVALLMDGEVIARGEGIESQAKVGELTNVVNGVIARSEHSLHDIDCVVISIGPGSYTGIRSGIAFGKGIEAGSDVDIRMIPLTYAMARYSAVEGVVGAVVRVGRSECAIEIFSGDERLHYDVIESDSLGEAIDFLTSDTGVNVWMIDPRLRQAVSGVKVNLGFAEVQFAELLGTAVSSVDPTSFDPTAYLVSKF